MSVIIRQDSNGVKPLLNKGELGYDAYTSGGDEGRVWVGTGTQNIAIAKKSEVDLKVDKVTGKGLSTEDYTTTEKAKLSGIEVGATADMTASEILTAIKTVDGIGSGLDADLLDGLHATSFIRSDTDTTATARTIHSYNTPALSGNSYNQGAVEIRTTDGSNPILGFHRGGYSATALYENDGKLYTRNVSNVEGIVWTSATDGSGSGLDADLLDGLDSSQFVRSDANTTISGNLTFDNGTTDSSGFSFKANGSYQDINVDMVAGKLRWFRNDGTSPLFINTDNNIYSNNGTNGNGKVWTSAIDGSGSGLDADLLDGLHATSFIRSDTSSTFTGKLSVGSTTTRDAGVYGIYDSTKTGHIWSMGTDYAIPADGSTFGTLYGIAYKHTNNTTGGNMAGGHQVVFCDYGIPGVAIGLGGGIWTSGRVTAPVVDVSGGRVEGGMGGGALAYNTAIGTSTLSYNTTGNYNTAVGALAIADNTTGNYNTAVGVNAVGDNTTGNYNTAVGFNAVGDNTTGNYNTAVGANALADTAAGDQNTAIGAHALYHNTTGSNNTAVGFYALTNITTYANCTGIGYNAQITNSNQVQLGDSYATTYVYGTVQNRSDERDKADIEDSKLGLEFITSLRPVSYKWDMREDYKSPRPEDIAIPDTASDEEKEAIELQNKEALDKWLEENKLENIIKDGSKKRNRNHYGFIAQEVQSLGVDFGGLQDHSKSGGDDVLSLGYDEFIAPIVKAIQEQQEIINDLKARLDSLATIKG